MEKMEPLHAISRNVSYVAIMENNVEGSQNIKN
jgi:hypothetical protein